MKKLPFIAGAVALLLGAALAYVYLFEVRPWLAPPDAPAWAIEERWKKVAALAAVPAECGGDACSRDRSALERYREALAAIGADVAADAGPTAPERGALTAALDLGRELRRCGDFVAVNIGFVLAGRVVERAREHGLRADPGFVELRPRAEEVLPAVARDAVCLVELARGADPELPRAAPSPTRDPVGMDRELLMLQQYYADLLLPFASDPTDLDGLAAALEPPDEEQLPRSLLLRGVAVPRPFAAQVRKLAAIITEYDAFLAAGVVDAGADSRSDAGRPARPAAE